ncbi:porin family protein [Ramlibacter sp. USB13]|uniref:Porin family protein n=1 Tax=Ramlibacter cellulosilyticus TaxID=2764187 RepID=A0A923MV63_9BURK|nr:outer membrane beta-barrel protein [Ramlibacter cellulosilyticus]MBC5784774.1 porin family protein [Ramlibacter cellulosilyticus]
MKRLTLAAAAALVAMGSAHAQMMMPSASQVYGELGYTWLKIDAAGTSGRPSAIRGILGWEFHPMFAGEFMLAGGVNDDNKGVSVNGVPTNVEFELKNMYGLFLKPRYLVQQAELFARLGYAHTKVRAASTNNNLIQGQDQSDNDFAWGIGANYRFNPRMYVGLDWMRYSNQSGHKVDGLTLGFGYHW